MDLDDPVARGIQIADDLAVRAMRLAARGWIPEMRVAKQRRAQVSLVDLARIAAIVEMDTQLGAGHVLHTVWGRSHVHRPLGKD